MQWTKEELVLCHFMQWTNKLIVNFNDVCQFKWLPFFRHSTCLPIEKDAPTCKCFLHIQPNDDSEKTILGVRAQILCVFYVPVSKTKGMFKDKIRLKRLHSAQTSLFYDENIHFWANRHTTAHQIAVTSLCMCGC